MRFRSLVGMEREKLENEYAELEGLTEEWKAILADENKLFAVIKEEMLETKRKYGDERRTLLVDDMGEINMEDIISDDMSVITMTHLNYVKRIPLDTYKSQHRGGKGVIGLQMREEDGVKKLFVSSNHSYILFFTTKGKVYRKKTWEIPEAGRNAKGTPIVNLLELEKDEEISAVIPTKSFNENEYLVMVTKYGIIKKTPAEYYNNIRKGGLIAVNLRDNDKLISVFITTGKNDIFVATRNGISIRFNESDARPLSRTATGVKAITLTDDDYVIGADVITDGSKLLIVSEKGYGKCTMPDNYRIQSRGGKGLKTYKITDRTGYITAAAAVNDSQELIMVSSEGVVIRIKVKDISTVGRVAQGVKLVNLNEGVRVISMDTIDEEYVNSESSSELANESLVVNENVNTDK